MSRSWKQDRTTPKTTPVKAPRPRVSEFAADYYKGQGYQVEVPCVEPQTLRNNGQFDDMDYPLDPYCDDGLDTWEARLLPIRACTCGQLVQCQCGA